MQFASSTQAPLGSRRSSYPICPGYVLTSQVEVQIPDQMAARIGEPAVDQITGNTISVDGGWTAL